MSDTATVERELAALEDALDTGAADHHDPLTRELQELALALRADAPGADPGFRRQLRGRVDTGFPKPASSRRPLWRRMTTPAFATALVVLPLVLIAVVAGNSGQSDQSGGGGGGESAALESGGGGGGAAQAGGGGAAPRGSGGRAAEPALGTRDRTLAGDPDAQLPAGRAADGGGADQASGGAADQTSGGSSPAIVLPPDGGFAPGERNRRIERSIGLELEMPVDKMARVAEQVTTVTNRYGGFVLSSSVSTGEESAGGDFELRIPATRLRPALRDLAALADVRTQTQTGRDVTREHVTAKDRLQAARAERRSLLRRLELATTDEEAEAIRRRLDLVAGEIHGLRAKLRGLRLRTDYAVVTVSLLPKDGNQGGAAGGSFDDALGDAGHLLVGVAGVLVRALAVALPVGLIALAGWLVGRAVRRRQRESALA
jgi:hypothetical protein